MNTTRRAAVLVLSVLGAFAAVPANVQAQEKGSFGLAMGYPTSIGAVWHLSNSIALRPDVQFSFGSSETTSDVVGEEISSETDTSNVEFGISLLFYQQEKDRLRTYFTPRFAYARNSISASREFPFDLDLDLDALGLDNLLESTISTYSYSGAFGGQYALNDRFSLFGEIGVEFVTSSSGDSSLSDRDSWNVGLRSAVGVILYLK